MGGIYEKKPFVIILIKNNSILIGNSRKQFRETPDFHVYLRGEKGGFAPENRKKNKQNRKKDEKSEIYWKKHLTNAAHCDKIRA